MIRKRRVDTRNEMTWFIIVSLVMFALLGMVAGMYLVIRQGTLLSASPFAGSAAIAKYLSHICGQIIRK